MRDGQRRSWPQVSVRLSCKNDKAVFLFLFKLCGSFIFSTVTVGKSLFFSRSPSPLPIAKKEELPEKDIGWQFSSFSVLFEKMKTQKISNRKILGVFDLLRKRLTVSGELSGPRLI